MLSFKKGITFLLTIFFLLALIPLGKAAILKGKVYGPDLEPLERAIVELNTTPKQIAVVRADQLYQFELPPGVYELEAYGPCEGAMLYTKEKIRVEQEGIFSYDLILFQAAELELELNESELALIESLTEKEKHPSLIVILIIVVAAVVAFLTYFFLKRKRKKQKKKKKKTKPVKLVKLVGNELFEQVLAFIKKEKRVTQKEIRKKFSVSEAKISLLMEDLKDRGLIKKIKKGRGNIIIYQGK